MQNKTKNCRRDALCSSLFLALGLSLAASDAMAQVAGASAPTLVAKPKPSRVVPFKAPDLASLAQTPHGDEILYGYRLLSQTKKLLPNNVGAGLNCTSCHLGGGSVPLASPFVGLDQRYPIYNPRAARVVSMADRINGCMLRSMNGKPIPKNSREMKAMLSYMTWISKNVPADAKVKGGGMSKVNTALKPDSVHGKEIYASRCAACHGVDGEGTKNTNGGYLFPPLWGPDSFNVGAGMARTYTAANFVKGAMPVAAGLHPPLGVGAMSDQDAIDVAEYFSHQPRPDFPAAIYDWPKGGAPKDVRYCLVSLGNCTPAEIAKAPKPPGGK